MTSPITHEKIIEVLRPFAAFAAAFDKDSIKGDALVASTKFGGLICFSDCEAARDLYPRLQAEKEGGWNGSYWHLCNPDQPPLNQEGGDAAVPGPGSRDPSRPHVAPPASASAGTGRATIAKPPFHSLTGAQREEVLKALAAERQRGLAEGKRIGIEEAAKAVGEIADKLAQRPERTVAEIVDLINEMPLRALTGDPQT